MAHASPRTYVFDLDGVIYRGSDPLPHASETLAELRHRTRKIFFFTNNSASSRDDYLVKLHSMNIEASRAEIMTSAYATTLYLRERSTNGARVYVVGGAGLATELSDAGFKVVPDCDGQGIDYVVVGLDRQFTYQKLYCAQQTIQAGAQFIATNTDATYPVEDRVVPGAGSIVASIATASGREPVVIGKPEAYALDKILDLSASRPEETVMVGDRLDTDILLGKRAGLPTVLPLTGVTTPEMLAQAPPELRPDRVIEDLIELLDETWITG